MKNALKKSGIITIAVIIVLAMAACETTSASKTATSTASAAAKGLTITGLDDYIGMRVRAEWEEEVWAGDRVIGFDPMAGVRMAGIVITGGTVTLNVWNVEMGELDEETFTQEVIATPYTGSSEMTMNVAIWDGDSETFFVGAKAIGQMTVTFTNGAASGEFTATYIREEDD